MTQEKNNIVVEKIFKVIGEIDRKTVKLDAVKFLDVFMDISLSICHEFGDFKKLDDMVQSIVEKHKSLGLL